MSWLRQIQQSTNQERETHKPNQSTQQVHVSQPVGSPEDFTQTFPSSQVSRLPSSCYGHRSRFGPLRVRKDPFGRSERKKPRERPKEKFFVSRRGRETEQTKNKNKDREKTDLIEKTLIDLSACSASGGRSESSNGGDGGDENGKDLHCGYTVGLINFLEESVKKIW